MIRALAPSIALALALTMTLALSACAPGAARYFGHSLINPRDGR